VHRWYRIAFNVVAAITFLPLLALLAFMPDRTLYVIPRSWRWLTLGGQALAVGALLWTLLQTNLMHFAGLAQLRAADPTQGDALQVRGFYCYVRHPLYLFGLLLLWLTPVMTVNLATGTVLTTIYLYVGSIFEERKLLHDFGEAYAAYRQRVPRLIPRLRRCPSLDSGQID